jgi:hypothetical protein
VVAVRSGKDEHTEFHASRLAESVRRKSGIS